MFCTQCMWHKFTDKEYDMDFKVHSVKERTVTDIDAHGKAVKIVIKHKRYKCPFCGKTFYEPLESVERNDKITIRLKEQIQKECLKEPFTTIGERYDLSHTSVRRYFEEWLSEQEEDREIKAPRILGIDEAHLNKTMRGVFTDIENKKLIEITPNNLKRTVKETILNMKGYKDIEVVTMDMAPGYRYACNEVIPEAFIVIDKFHVVQYVQMAFNRIRVDIKNSMDKRERKLLMNDKWILQSNKEDLKPNQISTRDEWFKFYPQLGIAYWLKEDLRDIYLYSNGIEEATERFRAWNMSIPLDFKPYRELQKTYAACRQEILNYFIHPYTNAYTESVNNVIKMVEKEGKGYSYEILRAKVLYGTQATKRPKYGESPFTTFDHVTMNNLNILGDGHTRIGTDYNNLIEGFGVDLTTLSKILEGGNF